jgi:predicted DNA-binding transcriptional regulator AlpA
MTCDTYNKSSSDPQIVPALLTKTMIRKLFIPAGKRTLDKWISSGVFPRPDIAIGGKVRYWRRETVDAWIETQSQTQRTMR